MKNQILSAAALAGLILSFSSCKKEDNPSSIIKAYTVPTTYNFANAKYTQSTQLVKMAVEIDAYLKKPNAGGITSVVTIDQTTLNNMFSNTGNPFTDAMLNSAGINITSFTSEASLYKAYADSVILYNDGDTASEGTGGYVARGTNKIVVGPRGLEYGQAFTKGVMGAMLFKEAVNILNAVKSIDAKDTIAAQAKWDAAFGLLSVPADYDPAKTYTSADANRPLLWGGYLAERGKAISAGSTLFNAFLKGRAAIGGYDKTVLDEQIDIILAKWEQLAAAAAMEYVTSPTTTANVGNKGSQLHALSEGFGFMVAFKYRPANSKLSASNYEILKSILNKDFYALIKDGSFTDLKNAQSILKTTYAL
ncbi:MAG: DUF4856 domain-containing protein [Chitinophagaceae bacterium]|jgi:hypothetical protein